MDEFAPGQIIHGMVHFPEVQPEIQYKIPESVAITLGETYLKLTEYMPIETAERVIQIFASSLARQLENPPMTTTSNG
jgi:hypothetical protein